ncbi:hypothetical protein ACFY3V_29260 [Streptosporangium sp. NPDC000095]|uniref:hypothetical protein n=1 Tax=Streptosporangium sp. NPDC000095 TaxID=3366184 RepID=UPI003681E6C5
MTLAITGLLAGPLQLSALSETAAESSPTPIPSAASPQPKPPEDQPKPYQPVERPESELHKKLAAQKPDFGDEDPLSRAWNRSEIGIDEYVRHSVERLASPDNVPAKYRSKEGVPHEAGLALHYALSPGRSAGLAGDQVLAGRGVQTTRSRPGPIRAHPSFHFGGRAMDGMRRGPYLPGQHLLLSAHRDHHDPVRRLLQHRRHRRP